MHDQPRRRRTTRTRVKVVERLARTFITLGGMGTILAVGLICLFLVWVVMPLFTEAQLETESAAPVAVVGDERPLALSVDEHQRVVASVGSGGDVHVRALDNGATLQELNLFPGTRPTASAVSVDGSQAIFGFQDGTLRLAKIEFDVQFPGDGAVPEEQVAASSRETVVWDGGVLHTTPDGRVRLHKATATADEPLLCGDGEPIHLVDRSGVEGRTTLAALTESGRLFVLEISERVNLLTDELTRDVESFELEYERPPGRSAPEFLLLNGRGDRVFLLWPDGYCYRFDARNRSGAGLAEITTLIPEGDAQLVTAEFVLGRSTIVTGDTKGRLRGWFATKPEDAGTIDGVLLALAKEFPTDGRILSALAPSVRSRLLLAAFEDGSVALYNITAAERIGSAELAEGSEISALRFFPKENGALARVGDKWVRWRVDPRYPEATFAALFRPVWYEGYSRPEYVWQSSSGTDDFETKLGLVPLIFGTLKATFYSMLFGAPLALLAAIYTSEFLHRRLRTPIKSAIELMASLPSVVLGFLAALVVAPFVQSVLPATLAVFLTVPLALLIGAYLWQLLPTRLSVRFGGAPKLACIALALPVGLVLATGTGFLGTLPVVGGLFSSFSVSGLGYWLESWLFAGDTALWLDGQVGSAFGGWFFLLIPLSVLATTLFFGRVVAPALRRVGSSWSADVIARVDFLKFFVGIATVCAVSAALAWVLQTVGLDPRGMQAGLSDYRPVGTYVQRNAMIVGFAMGFAVVPIIYTIAEDALGSVPEHLRLASLGAGATPWQTAIRVIVPTAASGLFSALMVGLGRAVGETMVVLMATGNTAVLDLNAFNGFRTLSANIAVELPEAVQNSTHYRTLFLAALVLFAMTFVVNTVAEVIRQRMRKRAYQL